LYASRAPEGLPDAVEVLPLEMLAEALAWADYIAAVFPYPKLAELRRLAGLTPHQTFRIDAEALLLVPMPCGGLGQCGACAVLTSHGWKHACSDGPVFPLNQLEES
jgi:dihydroorotate dehydrogenase electron transfer subunit